MNLIAAVDRNWGIGKDGKLLFSLPGDMRYFVKMTTGKVVVMGRKTFASFPGQRPLKNRINVVLSNNPDFHPDGVTVVNGYDALFAALKHYDTRDVFVIGGASVYNALLPYCDTAYITHVEAEAQADSYLCNLQTLGNWKCTEASAPHSDNGIFYTFHCYRRQA